ncbi:MAG: TolC family protein [Phaeodactylibacter xiamenensis]|uniref:RND transporter n=1 Tax=Phaeodactylibacter xiamenensis TaxID=1524460 RepID=A0A098S3U6_9BACT|nr:TolC family protein [Phaeodactylibacter xiamenensis]KGE85807.1 RND transporter [Phaeodactylibacter xiamenensis]MCR9051182.1 TolC family protein [bacterium]
MTTNNIFYRIAIFLVLASIAWSCNVPEKVLLPVSQTLPDQYEPLLATDSTNIATISWRAYFDDPNLIALIDSALQNNQELNILLQEIQVSQNEVLEREGEYLPFVRLGAGIGAEKPGRYTRAGAVEEQLDIEPEKAFPEPLGDFQLGAVATWEVDIWRKLRNAKDAAQLRYLAATEGRNFLVTNLVAEISETYYELLALDNLLKIINDNLLLQQDALSKVKLQKENARATQLAVNRFEAQLLNTRNLQYAIKQQITEAENRINFLAGRYPSEVARNPQSFMDMPLDSIQAGVPAELLANRPDIRQAEYELAAANLDIDVARADFYPRLDITAGLGFQAFNPKFLASPESVVFNLAGDLMAPLINKKAIQARYNMATAKQIQAVYAYEQTVLSAYTDLLNQLNKLNNYSKSFDTKTAEVDILNKSVNIANSLYRNARADYVEVLLTQEEVLDAKMELMETRLEQLQAKVAIYRTLGGGWR